MSWVFLSDPLVYKLKKPVRYPFLDFTTLEARRLNCGREVELNRRLAHDVYLGVVPLTLAADGSRFEIDGKGSIVDWLVRMRRLPTQRMLDAAIRNGTASTADIEQLARCLTQFYRGARKIKMGADTYRSLFAQGMEANRAELLRPVYGLCAEQVERITTAQHRYLAAGTSLQQRALADRIVDAHGDLRPEHICLTAEPAIIDCLEFNADFRVLDPVDELAYLAVECERLGAGRIGDEILNRSLEMSRDAPGPELVRFYKSYRACLRAKIAVWHIDDHSIRDTEKWRNRANEYLALGERYADLR